MSKLKVYNQEGKEIKDIDLNPEIFDIKINNDLVHQVVVAQMANGRHVLAHTKGRSEVRGGGKKPWKQKGTGRARHGSNRSPIWIGGGVTFGPTKERNFSQKINKRMKAKALFMCLTGKNLDKNLVVVDKLDLGEIKTKKIVEILSKLPVDKKILIVLPDTDLNIIKSISNIPHVKAIRADSLNVIDILNYKNLLVLEDSLKKIEQVYLTKEKARDNENKK